jgi:ATP-binding cassette subfamily B protein
VLDEGEILQEGSHNQLISQDGYYKALYEQQLQDALS